MKMATLILYPDEKLDGLVEWNEETQSYGIDTYHFDVIIQNRGSDTEIIKSPFVKTEKDYL
jgi:hypothetical protein